MMVLDQELIKLNCQITSHYTHLVQDLTQALETRIICIQRRLMDLVQVHISYHLQSSLESKQIIENFCFIIWLRTRTKMKIKWQWDMIKPQKLLLVLLEENSLTYLWTTQDQVIIDQSISLKHLIITQFQRLLIIINKKLSNQEVFQDQDLIKLIRELLIKWTKPNQFLEVL